MTNEKGKCVINPKWRLFQDGRHFASCKGCWNHISRLCRLLTCHFLKMMSQALQLSIFLTLCCTFSLVICTSTPSAPVPVSRIMFVFLFGIMWSLAEGLSARNSYLSTLGFAFRLVYPSLTLSQ